MLSSLEQLPSDILLKMCDLLDSCDAKCLRLASKSMNLVAVPRLFLLVDSDPRLQSQQQCYEMESDIVTGRTDVFANTRNLIIHTEFIGKRLDDWKPWFQLWKAFGYNMHHLSSLTWRFTACAYPEEWLDGFIQAIGSHQSLLDLDFEVLPRGGAPPMQVSLRPLSHLRSLSVTWWRYDALLWPELIMEISSLLSRCQNLEYLKLGSSRSYFQVEAELLDSFGEFVQGWLPLEAPLRLRSLVLRGLRVTCRDSSAHIRHLRMLEELVVEWDLDPLCSVELGKIFALLCQERIYLKRVSVCFMKPEIVGYLSSYTGLESFSMWSYDIQDDTHLLIQQFLEAIKFNCRSLKSLYINVDRISRWHERLRGHFSESAELYCTLKELAIQVYITPDDVEAKRPDPLVLWFKVAMRLPALQTLRWDPVWEKTGVERARISEDAEYLLPSDPESVERFETYVRTTIGEFIREHNPKFEIQTGYR